MSQLNIVRYTIPQDSNSVKEIIMKMCGVSSIDLYLSLEKFSTSALSKYRAKITFPFIHF